jgi:peptidyl-prolyl cis-trans isomerase C
MTTLHPEFRSVGGPLAVRLTAACQFIIPLAILLLAILLLAVVLHTASPGAHAQSMDAAPGLRVTPITPPEGRNTDAPRHELTPKQAGAPVQAETDPVVASVEGHLIHLSDLGRASQTLPENLRDLPFDTLFPVLLDRMVDHEALVMMARRKGLEDNPAVRKDIQAATERVLEGALLAREAVPRVTDPAIQALYDRQFGSHSASDQVRARHILVATEEEARKVIAELGSGADFATVAKRISKDPDAQKGGELGFFRREQVWPAFADMAFTLQPGQIGQAPIRNEFGWHVIKVEERRSVAPPGISEVREALRQELLAQAIKQVVTQARSDMSIHKFNLDGSEMDALPKAGTSR